MKIPNKRELQQISLKKLHQTFALKISLRSKKKKKKCPAGPFLLVNDNTLVSDNPLRFRKNLFNIK